MFRDYPFKHPFEPLSHHLRCACHALLFLHFMLSGDPSDIAFLTLLATYFGVNLMMLFPSYHLGSLVASLLVAPTLNIVAFGISDDPGDALHLMGRGFIPFALIGLHLLFYAVDSVGDRPDHALLTMDIVYTCGVAAFVVYQHHPRWLTELAATIIQRGWFIGVAAFAVGIIVFVSRHPK